MVKSARIEVEPSEDVGPVDLSGLAGVVGYPLRRAQMVVFDDFARRFSKLALTPAQFSTLVAIDANPGRRQSDIGGALGIQRPNFVAMMDELERRGLAERVRYGADRRSNALALTAAGKALLGEAREAQAQQENSIEALMGRAERERLIASLSRLTELS